MAQSLGNKLGREWGDENRGRKPAPAAKSDRLVRSGVRLHPGDGTAGGRRDAGCLLNITLLPGLLHTRQAAWELSRATFFSHQNVER